ncbi:MAG: hypothetical protein J07HX64_02410 [halophilic archaeon J07HX64]|jgi:hypothetical protein|nr:MAG: hypothetical protein J07HX64_02410 [halophilic archaeon J07HX64]
MTNSETDPMAEYEQLRGEAGDLFPVSLDGKVLTAVVGSAMAALFGPLLAVQSSKVRALEGGPDASLNVVGGIPVLLGVVLMFVGGGGLVYQKYYVGQQVEDEDRMEWFIRVEDLWMWTLTVGVILTVLCLLLLVPGAFSLLSPETVSDAGFGIYGAFDPLPITFGAWLVSGISAGSALVLGLSWLWVNRTLRRAADS